MDDVFKKNLLIYLVVSAITFALFILVRQAGISVLLFIAVQFGFLYFLVPYKKPLLLFIPIFVLGLNSFISANTMWQLPNFFVGLVLYGVMTLWLCGQFSFGDSFMRFLVKPLVILFAPFTYFKLPVSWSMEGRRESIPLIKRVALGVAISIPVLIFLIAMLSGADEIFNMVVGDFFSRLSFGVNFRTIGRFLIGIFVGFYLFGLIFYVHDAERTPVEVNDIKQKKGDLLVINIVLSSVLLIYTVFVVIQFRYLFASPDNLPYGLDFVQYARRGFFELMALAGVNIFSILITIWLTAWHNGFGTKLNRGLCQYLCGVTVVLLVSSFYRMWLYGSDDGLTRMRFMVFCFLVFKAFGLGATFVYIAKPKFNIVAVYTVIALVFYLFLNVVPMDSIVARSQVNRYLNTGRGGVSYVLSLSPDAAGQVMRLIENGGAYTQSRAVEFFDRDYYSGWRQFNLSLWRYRIKARPWDGVPAVFILIQPPC